MNWLQRFLGRSREIDRMESGPLDGENFKVIHSQAQLASEIRALVAGGREPPAKEVIALQDRFSRNLASEVPDFIAHWFADAKSRQRGDQYGKAQALQLEAALRQMEKVDET